MIVLAECCEGIGSSTFLPYLNVRSSEEIAQNLLKDYKINGHTALALKTKTEKANIVFVSELETEIVEKTGMIPACDLIEAWKIVAKGPKKNNTGYVMPLASVYVPISC